MEQLADFLTGQPLEAAAEILALIDDLGLVPTNTDAETARS